MEENGIFKINGCKFEVILIQNERNNKIVSLSPLSNWGMLKELQVLNVDFSDTLINDVKIIKEWSAMKKLQSVEINLEYLVK